MDGKARWKEERRTHGIVKRENVNTEGEGEKRMAGIRRAANAGARMRQSVKPTQAAGALNRRQTMGSIPSGRSSDPTSAITPAPPNR